MTTPTGRSTTVSKVIDSEFPTGHHGTMHTGRHLAEFEVGGSRRRAVVLLGEQDSPRIEHTSFVDQSWASTAILKLLAEDMMVDTLGHGSQMHGFDPLELIVTVPGRQPLVSPILGSLGTYTILGVDYSADAGLKSRSGSDSSEFAFGGILDFVTTHWLASQDPEELFPNLVATVESYMAAETAILGSPLPELVGRAALRIATSLACLTGYEPFISADDQGSALVTVRLNEQRLVYVEIDEDSFEAVMYTERGGTTILKAKTERELLREVLDLVA